MKQQPASTSENEQPKSPKDEPLKAELAPTPEMQPASASLHTELHPRFRAKLELTPTALQNMSDMDLDQHLYIGRKRPNGQNTNEQR